MKILCLSDLHLRSNAVSDFLTTQKASPFLREITATVAEVSPDVVVVTGDTVWSRQVRKLSFVLRKLIPGDIPIVATLGNHEFWERTFSKVPSWHFEMALWADCPSFQRMWQNLFLSSFFP